MGEHFNPLIHKKNAEIDEEFNNFMLKVNEVKKLMDGLTSKDKNTSSETIKLVDNYLGDPDKYVESVDKDLLKVKSSRTVINQKAFDSIGKETQHTETPEAFMKRCEEDAKQRAEDRRQQKESSDTFKKQAISAFNRGDFTKALTYYNKAISEFKGSANLYQSRALTCLKLKLYSRTIEDCDRVLRCFDEKSLKALLFKAKAHQALNEKETADKCVADAIKNHPRSESDIREYMNKEENVDSNV